MLLALGLSLFCSPLQGHSRNLDPTKVAGVASEDQVALKDSFAKRQLLTARMINPSGHAWSGRRPAKKSLNLCVVATAKRTSMAVTD